MSINHLIFEETKPKYDIFVNNIECEDVKLQGSVEDLKFKAQNGDIIDLSSLPDHGLPSQRLTSNGNGEVSWVAGAGTSGIEYSGGEPVQLNKLAKYDATDGSLVAETSFIDTDIILKDGSVPMAGNLSMGGNNIFDVISVKTDSTTGNIRTNTINSGTTSGITFNSANNIVMNNTLDMSNNTIDNVFRLNVGRIKNPSLANIEIENDLFLRNNNIIEVDNINVDSFSVNSLPAILFNDDVSLFNNNIVSAGDIKTTSFSSTDGKTNDIDVNCNFDLQTTRNIKNVNILQTNEIAKTSGVAVIFDDNIEMGGIYDITNCNQLEVSSIASAVTSDINILNTLDLNTNVIEKVSSINGLTPVGGLYSGISDGNVINQASGQSDLLPVDAVGSLNIPANGFKIGDAYHLVVAGTFPTEVKNDDITIEIKQNGTSLGTLTLQLKAADATPSNFEVEADFIIRSVGATGSVASNIDFTFNENIDSKFEGTRSTTITTIDTETASTLSVLATVTGGSSIQSRLAYLRKQY